MPTPRSNVAVWVDASQVNAMLDKAIASVSGPSLSEFLRTDASNFFREDIESRFNEEGDVKSGFWSQLHPTTQRIRESMGYDGEGPINVRTGDLQNFLTDSRDFSAGPGWAQMDVPGNPPTAVLRQKLETAQRGSASNPLGFPPTEPRPVLAFSEMDIFSVIKLLEDHIIKFIGGVRVGTRGWDL